MTAFYTFWLRFLSFFYCMLFVSSFAGRHVHSCRLLLFTSVYTLQPLRFFKTRINSIRWRTTIVECIQFNFGGGFDCAFSLAFWTLYPLEAIFVSRIHSLYMQYYVFLFFIIIMIVLFVIDWRQTWSCSDALLNVYRWITVVFFFLFFVLLWFLFSLKFVDVLDEWWIYKWWWWIYLNSLFVAIHLYFYLIFFLYLYWCLVYWILNVADVVEMYILFYSFFQFSFDFWKKK